MNGQWKKRLTALLLAMMMVLGTIPGALAAGTWTDLGNGKHTNGVDTEEHVWSSWSIDSTDSSRHVRVCLRCHATETASHTSTSTYGSDANYHWKVCDVCGAELSTTLEEHDMVMKSDGDYHWYECVCGLISGRGGHVDEKMSNGEAGKDGKCDTCGHEVPITYTVVFQTYSGKTEQTVLSGAKPSSPSTPADFSRSSRTYTFVGWTTTDPGSTYLYVNQSLTSPSGQAVTADVTYYAVYKEVDKGLISYSVSPGGAVRLDDEDFDDAYREISGSNRAVRWVEFTVPSSYNNFAGKLYLDDEEMTRSELNGTAFYYEDQEYGDYKLGDLSFQADGKAEDGDVLTIEYRAYYSEKNYADGTLEIVIDGDSQDSIVYSVAPGEEIFFDDTDFNDFYKDVSGNTRSIRWVSFTAPNSYTSFKGSIYAGSDALNRSDLNNSDFYYSDKNYGDYELDELSFRADSDAKDGARISIDFRAYFDSKDYVDGVLEILIDKDAGGDIVYPVVPGKTVDFDASDFNTFFRQRYSGSTLRYVVFERPASDALSNGALYYDYGGKNELSFTRATFSSTDFYYSPSSKQYGLDDLTFEATSSFDKTVSLSFTAYGTGSQSVKGVLVLRPDSLKGDITYTVSPGQTVDFKRTDFNAFFRKTYRDTMGYVVFDRPASDAFVEGTLYAEYDTRSETAFTRTSLNGVKFYYDEDDVGRNSYYLDDLTFVASNRMKEAVRLSFTIYSDDGEDSVKGTVVITPDAATLTDYNGCVRYAAKVGNNVQINANDLARYYAKAVPGQSLQYVVITGVPSAGALYYNYYGTSSYGTSSRAVLTSANCAGQAFYLSPATTSQFALAELTYVPNGANYCVSIPFTAYGTGASVSGTILISVNNSTVAEIYGVTLKNTAVTLPSASLFSAVLTATGSALSSIQLLALPDASVGTLYVGSGTSIKADTSTAYGFTEGTYLISQLRFVPATNYTGSVEIPYMALNSSGTPIATGLFSMGIVASEKKFTDVTNSTWCYKYVIELSDSNIISGYGDGSFRPGDTVTYGAALKLIMLAAGYPEQAPTDGNVFSGYLARARADGIITRSDVNLSAQISRLQVAQLAAGAMKLDTSRLSSVKPFTDTNDIYVQALYSAGIVGGYFSNGVSTFKPENTLTRGELSAIVWRMKHYQ